MTSPNFSTTNKPHTMLGSLLLGAILGGALTGAGNFANVGFSLSLHASDNQFHVELAGGTGQPNSEGGVHAD